ncbi:hypothetical protein ACTFIW_005503 [Dictyostelium discoideum]
MNCCSPRKLVGLIALKDSVILFRLYTRRTNKFHSQCLTRQWGLGSIIPHSSRCQFRDFMLVDSSKPSNEQLLNNQNECIPPRLESMEAMSGLPTTHSFAFYLGEDELIQFEEGFYNTDLPNLEISNLVSDDSSSSSSSSSSHVSSSTGNIPRSIDQTISRVNTNLISSYTRFHNFCILNSLNPANITLDVFMDYLTHLFIHKPPLAFSTINGHRSMLNQLFLLKNQSKNVNL